MPLTIGLLGSLKHFAWACQGKPIQAAYEILGTGTPILLLPALSTVSSRDEMRPLASRLVQAGFACTLVDWPGFGSSTRGRLPYSPALLAQFLTDFCHTIMPPGSAVIAAGHASTYALALGQQQPGLWRRIVLLAPTWRGPLPTAMGPHPRTYATLRALVRSPAIGNALYQVNTDPRMIGMMYKRHVYADAGQVTPDFIATKRQSASRPGARFAAVAFVTGALDPVPDRQSFQALLRPPPAPTLILCGTATPPKSKAEMAAILPNPHIELQWVPGSLGLYEEAAAIISHPIATFLTDPA